MGFIGRQQEYDGPSAYLLSLLLAAARNELITSAIYSQLVKSADIERIPGLLGLSQMACSEDRDHYHGIVECIDRFKAGQDSHSTHATVLGSWQLGSQKLENLLRVLRQMEASSVKAYREICQITLGCDYRIFDLSYRNLNNNMEHQSKVDDILTKGLLHSLTLAREGCSNDFVEGYMA